MWPFSAGRLSQRRTSPCKRPPSLSLGALLVASAIYTSVAVLGQQTSMQQAPIKSPQINNSSKLLTSEQPSNTISRDKATELIIKEKEPATKYNSPKEAFQLQQLITEQPQQETKLQQLARFEPVKRLFKRHTNNLDNQYEDKQERELELQENKQQQQQEQAYFSDWWREFWSRKPFPSEYTQSSIILLACFIGIIILLIVVGNLLVCIAIFTEKSLKPTQNWFIASLAVSDMLLGLTVMPFSLARELMGFWMFGPLWCDIHEAMDVLLTTASINTLCLISLDRYWSITQAVNYLKKRTPRRGALMIAFVWVFSAAVSLPPLFGWRKQAPALSVKQPNHTAPAATTPIAHATQFEQRSNKITLSNSNKYQQQLSTPHILTKGQATRLRQQASNLLADYYTTDQLSSSNSNNVKTDQEPMDVAQSSYLHQQATSTPAPIEQLLEQQQGVTEYPTCMLSDDVGYVVYSALGSFYLPCAVMVFTYIKIFLAARSRARRTIVAKPSRNKMIQSQNNNNNNQDGHRNQQNRHFSQNRSTISASLRNKISSMGSASPTKSAKELLGGKCEPPMRGKIVIVERKKSLAASSLAPLTPLLDSKATDKQKVSLDQEQPATQMSLCTSQAHQASAKSAFHSTDLDSIRDQVKSGPLNQSESGSSIVTVMKPSMGQVSAMRFNFQTNDVELLASRERAEEERRQASALLEAITNIAKKQDAEAETLANQLEQAQEDDKKQQQGPSTKDTCFMTMDEDSEMVDTHQAGRTICMVAANCRHGEHDPTAKRHITANISRNNTITLAPAPSSTQRNPASSFVQCNNLACRRRQRPRYRHRQVARAATLGIATNAQPSNSIIATPASNRSGSSYCGSDTSMLEADCYEQDELDADELNDLERTDLEENDQDEDLLSDDACNGFSLSCGEELDSVCSRCHECDDAISQQSYAIQATLNYCPQHQHSSSVSAADSPCTKKPRRHSKSHNVVGSPATTTNPTDIDIEALKNRLQKANKSDMQQQQLMDEFCCRHHQQACQHDQCSELEIDQDADQDDDYEQDDDQDEDDDEEVDEDDEDETSSVMGRGILDATAKRKKSQAQLEAKTARRKSIAQDSTNSANMVSAKNNNSFGGRKRSIIGIRLPSLGGGGNSRPSSAQMLENNANESNNKTQTESLRPTSINATDNSLLSPITTIGTSPISQNAPKTSIAAALSAVAATANQDTAKVTISATSASIVPTRNLKALRQNFFLKLNQLTAKSSSKTNQSNSNQQRSQKLLSASSSDKPSLSYEPSTSCAMDYPMETTVVDEYDQQTSGENQMDSGNTIDMEPPSCQPANSSDQTTTCDDDNKRLPDTQKLSADKNQQARHQSSQQHQANKRDRLNNNSKSMIVSSTSAERSGFTTFDDHSGNSFRPPNNKQLQLYQHQSGQQHHQHSTNSSGKRLVKIEPSSQLSTTAAGRSLGPMGANSSLPGTKRAHLPSDTERHKRKLAKARERRATLILGLIMAAFITSWMPFFTYYIVRALCTACRDYISPRLEAFIFWMGYCNSAINPIIYTIFNRDFRKAFRKILFRCL